MRENGLLAPHRVGRTETKPHDGTIITDKVNTQPYSATELDGWQQLSRVCQNRTAV
jgi:hypothetical protein